MNFRVFVFIFCILVTIIFSIDDLLHNVGYIHLVKSIQGESKQEAELAESVFQYLSRFQDTDALRIGRSLSKALQGDLINARSIWPKKSSELSDIYSGWADSAYSNQDYEKALFWYHQSVLVDESSGRDWYYMGTIYEMNKCIQEAFIHYSRAAEEGYDDAILYQVEILKEQGVNRKAIDMLYKALGTYENSDSRPKWYYVLSNLLLIENRIDDAVVVLFEGISEYPDDPWFLVQRGRIDYFYFDNISKALENINKSLILDPNYTLSYQALGDINFNEGQFKEASEWYTIAIKHTPEDFSLYLRRANAIREQGYLDNALIQYLESINRFSNEPALYYEISWVYLLLEKGTESIKAIEQALELKTIPEEKYYIRAGLIYEHFGEERKALKAYQEALEFDKDSVEAINGIERISQ